jgi:heme-degrading monooxygenase HmoA
MEIVRSTFIVTSWQSTGADVHYPQPAMGRGEGGVVIARTWRGWTNADDADAYVQYLMDTGIAEYRRTPGNRAAYILRRDDGDRTEFVTLTFWDSMESVARFAGDDVSKAVFYAEDDRFLVDRETQAMHFDVIESPR